MATLRPGYKREGSMYAEELKIAVASGSPKSVTKELMDDSKADGGATVVTGEVGDALDPSNMLANGKERPIETALDYATRCDPARPRLTMRSLINPQTPGWCRSTTTLHFQFTHLGCG